MTVTDVTHCDPFSYISSLRKESRVVNRKKGSHGEHGERKRETAFDGGVGTTMITMPFGKHKGLREAA